MSERAAKRLYDGFRSLIDGVDSGVEADLIAPTQVSWAANVTVRGGKARTRPPFIKHALNFASQETRTVVNDAIFQVGLAYFGESNIGSLVFLAGGRLYKIAVENGFAVTDVSPLTPVNPTNLSRGWTVQAERYGIFQDGQTKPIIFNGAGSRYAAADEIKVGTVMASQNGRIWYSVGSTGTAFRATDLTDNEAAILKETENTFLNEGGDFSVPTTAGPITAMIAPAQLDTSQGQGPLQVLTTNSIFSVNAPIDRETWKDVTYPIQTYSLIEKGSIGWALGINGDIWYRSDDGARSFIVARRDFSDWGNTPQSSEMARSFDFDNKQLLSFGSAVLFDNRLLAVGAPSVTDAGAVVHSTLNVLDFRLVSGLKRKLPPSWEGVWTGLHIHQIVKGRFNGVERCFAFVRDSADTELQLWEVTYDTQAILYADQVESNVTNSIPCFIESHSMDFKNDNALKRLDTGSLFVNNLLGTVAFDVKYKPDQYPCWIDWHSWSVCVTSEQCELGPCGPLKNLKPQYRPKQKLPIPADDCDPSTGKLFRDFFDIQLRIAWTGQVTLQRVFLAAIDLPEPPYGACLGTESCKEIDCCDDPFEYDAGATPS